MAEDDELEKRAVEELLRETDRARVRAETMGPTGWLKCPLRGTNKRFLLNTLRSTGEPRDRPSTARGRPRGDSPDRGRDRSRTPPRDHRRRGDHTDHKHHHRDSCNNKDKKQDRDGKRTHRHKDSRDQRHGRDLQNKDRDSMSRDLSRGETRPLL